MAEDRSTAHLGQQRQRWHVGRCDGVEVPAVEGGDLGELQSLGNRDHRRICDAQREVTVSPHKFGGPARVLPGQLDLGEVASGHASTRLISASAPTYLPTR